VPIFNNKYHIPQHTSWMKKFYMLLSCLGLSSSLQALSLQETLGYGLDHAPDVQIAMGEEFIGRTNLSSKAGAFLPVIDANCDLVHDHYSQQNDTDPATTLWRKDYNLVISQNVFDGLKRYNDYEQAQSGLRATIWSTKDRILNKLTDIGSVYFKVLLAQERVTLAKENYKRLKEIANLIEQRSAQGLSREVDRIQAQGRVATAHASVINTLAELHKQQALFKDVTGGLNPIDLEVTELSALMPAEFNQYLESVHQYGARVRAAAFQQDAAYYQYQSAKSPFFPQVYGLARFEFRKNIDGNPNHQVNTEVGVNLTYNVFRGAQDMQQLSAQAIRYQQARFEVKRQRNEIDYLATASWEDWQSAQKSYQYRCDHERSIGTVVSAYKDQFMVGQRSLFDLLDVYNEWYYTQNAAAEDRAQLRIAEIYMTALNGSLVSILPAKSAEKIFFTPEKEEEFVRSYWVSPTWTEEDYSK